MAAIFGKHRVSIKRAVERDELPQPVRLMGQPVWTARARWRFWYIDYKGRRRWGSGTTRKAETLALARQYAEEHRQIRMCLRPVPRVSDAHHIV